MRSINAGNLLIFTALLSLVKSIASICFSTNGRLSHMFPCSIISSSYRLKKEHLTFKVLVQCLLVGFLFHVYWDYARCCRRWLIIIDHKLNEVLVKLIQLYFLKTSSTSTSNLNPVKLIWLHLPQNSKISQNPLGDRYSQSVQSSSSLLSWIVEVNVSFWSWKYPKVAHFVGFCFLTISLHFPKKDYKTDWTKIITWGLKNIFTIFSGILVSVWRCF